MTKFSKFKILAIIASVMMAQPAAAKCRVDGAKACKKEVIPPGLQIGAEVNPVAEPGSLSLLGASALAVAMLTRRKRRSGNLRLLQRDES